MGPAFNPAILFSSGQQGAWWDPSDFTTLFQDAAGSTQVTAVEQPVSVVLDKRLGLVRGPELVAGQTWSSMGVGASGGVNKVTFVAATAGSGGASAMIVAGKFYEVTYTISANTGGSIGLDVGGGAAVFRSANGVYTERKYASASGTLTATSAGTVTDGVFTINSCKLIDGNHLKAVNAVVSARVNLFTKSDQFDSTAWSKNGAGTGLAPVVTPNDAIAPDGTMTADRIIFDKGAGTTSTDQSFMQQAMATVTGQPTVAFISLKSATASSYLMRIDFNGTSSEGASFPSLVTITPSWQRFEVRLASASDAVRRMSLRLRGTLGTSDFADVHVWGAQQEVATLPAAYQRVNTATDYDTVGFPMYLVYNGTSTTAQTFGNVDFSSTDKMTFWTGVKITTTTALVIAELSANATTNAGAFYLVSNEALNQDAFLSRGSLAGGSALAPAVAAPRTRVITGIGNIGADTNIIRVNAIEVASNIADQGTGNYGNYPVYVGARGAAASLFVGNIYSMIIRGTASTAAEITSTETYVNGKTGAY